MKLLLSPDPSFYVRLLQIRSKIKFPLCSHNEIRRAAA